MIQVLGFISGVVANTLGNWFLWSAKERRNWKAYWVENGWVLGGGVIGDFILFGLWKAGLFERVIYWFMEEPPEEILMVLHSPESGNLVFWYAVMVGFAADNISKPVLALLKRRFGTKEG